MRDIVSIPGSELQCVGLRGGHGGYSGGGVDPDHLGLTDGASVDDNEMKLGRVSN